jgi:hypothetical protein
VLTVGEWINRLFLTWITGNVGKAWGGRDPWIAPLQQTVDFFVVSPFGVIRGIVLLTLVGSAEIS